MKSDKRPNPVVRKGAAFPFQIAVVCWIDLLGYGAMIAEADFNPLHPRASQAMKRLRDFHSIVALHSERNFPTLVMNDGAAAYRDLSFRSREPTYEFLIRAWNLFTNINEEEKKQGLPGARAVLATGFRMRGRRAGMDARASHFQSVMHRFQSGHVNGRQAIREVANIQQSFDVVPQLQAIFAFSKAYVANSSGTRGGLAGANFFVDLALFDMPIPKWIVTTKIVEWSNEKLHMKARLAPIVDVPPSKHTEGGPSGIRDGLQVAQHLTQDSRVLEALRAAQKPG